MSPHTSARRFQASQEVAMRDLQRTLGKMSASGLRVAQDYDTGSAEIVFDRTGKRYVFRCKRWPHPTDNLRAAQRTITLLYQAMEEYGTTSSTSAVKSQSDPFEQFFLSFAALPDDSVLMLGSGKRSWWKILGINETATKADIINAYRALARVHHPDVGGDAEMFKAVRKAYDDGMAAR